MFDEAMAASVAGVFLLTSTVLLWITNAHLMRATRSMEWTRFLLEQRYRQYQNLSSLLVHAEDLHRLHGRSHHPELEKRWIDLLPDTRLLIHRDVSNKVHLSLELVQKTDDHEAVISSVKLATAAMRDELLRPPKNGRILGS